MSKLKQRFENACNEYVDIFCEKQGLKNEGWVNDEVGEIICCSSYFFSLRDIRHDIDTNQPKDNIFDWYFANLENPDKAINYDSYTKGLRIENIPDLMFSFSDIIGFSRWLLKSDEFGNVTRYIYIESENDFIDDDGNRYDWEDLYKIYQKI